jgi:hypothetical protein
MQGNVIDSQPTIRALAPKAGKDSNRTVGAGIESHAKLCITRSGSKFVFGVTLIHWTIAFQLAVES